MFLTEEVVTKSNSSFEFDVRDDINSALPFLNACFWQDKWEERVVNMAVKY